MKMIVKSYLNNTSLLFLVIVSNHVGNIKHQLPEFVFNVTCWAVSFTKINRSAFSSEIIEYFNKLSVCFIGLFSIVFEQNIGFIIAVETPMVLVKTSDSHCSTVIDCNCFHMEVFVRLFVYDCTAFLKSLKQYRIQKVLITRLISVASRNDFKLYSSLHCIF